MVNSTFRCVKYDPTGPVAGTVFFISSFKSRVWYYRLAIRQLLNCGFQVYAYDYNWKPLLDAYPHEWVEFSERIHKDITMKMDKEISEDSERRFGIIGVSIGATIALHAAKLLPKLEKIMLVTVHGSMTQHIWEHSLLQSMRNKCKELNLDYQKTYKAFGYFEPTYRLNLIGNRPILLFTNKKDPVIPYGNTQQLIDEAGEKKVWLIVRHIEAIRHSVTIVKVFNRPGLWISFFTALRYPAYPVHHSGSDLHHTSNKVQRKKHATR
jgi:esterase/lipase